MDGETDRQTAIPIVHHVVKNEKSEKKLSCGGVEVFYLF